MIWPSKVTKYSESTLSLFPVFLNELNKVDLSPNDLFKKTKKKVKDIREFVEVLECLYALNKIELKGEKIHYVD